MARPVIALLTDFGLSDHYVGTMKGVMLDTCPEASLVDITHELPAHDILAGALELAAAWRYFPAGTVFLVVVDPGVGSARRAIAAQTNGFSFVAPDNGVLSLVLGQGGEVAQVVELTDARYRRAAVSRTFEGRDRLAPAAAWLASGVALSALGTPAGEVVRLAVPQPRLSDGAIEGEVLRIDRFGNLETNIHRTLVDALTSQGAVRLRIGDRVIAGIGSTYSDAPVGEVCALFSSADHLEIAANRASAAVALAARRGTAIRVEVSPILRDNIPGS